MLGWPGVTRLTADRDAALTRRGRPFGYDTPALGNPRVPGVLLSPWGRGSNSLIAQGGRLPEPASRFVGRSQEAAAIRDALARSRLVTLTGPGGVGKTRLAVRVAGEAARTFPDGVFLADLSAARDAAGVARAVASALGGRGLPGSRSQPPAGWLATRLRGRRVLLILDTCEHVVDACADLADTIVHGAAEPVLLATGRQPLDLPGEVVFRVPPLGVADGGGEAVSLLADRAAAVPGFAVMPGMLPRLVDLCRLLDGMPLAIELAALWLRGASLDELLGWLPGHLRQLGRGLGRPAAAAARHQSLYASAVWSYDLCTPAERLLWTRLSVFPGSFDLAAAEAVCGSGTVASRPGPPRGYGGSSPRGMTAGLARSGPPRSLTRSSPWWTSRSCCASRTWATRPGTGCREWNGSTAPSSRPTRGCAPRGIAATTWTWRPRSPRPSPGQGSPPLSPRSPGTRPTCGSRSTARSPAVTRRRPRSSRSPAGRG